MRILQSCSSVLLVLASLSSSIEASGSCGSNVEIGSKWSGNMGATLKIPVSRALTSYVIDITTDIPLTGIVFWDADVTPGSGTRFRITPKSWFWGAAAGTQLSLGFQVSFSGSFFPCITSIKFYDGSSTQELCGSSPAPTTAPPVTTTRSPITTTISTSNTGSCDSVLTGLSSWSGGLGATLNLPVTADITTYTLYLVTDRPVTSIVFWNADVSPTTGTTFTVTPKSWFSGAGAGTTISLGFQLQFSGTVVPKFTSVQMNAGGSVRNLCTGGGLTNPTTAPATTTARPITSTAQATTTARPITSTASATTTARPITSTATAPPPVPSGGCSVTSSEPISEEVRKLRQLTCMLPNSEVENVAPRSTTNPANVKIVESILSESAFKSFFPNANPAYTYTNFLKAFAKFPGVCTTADVCRKTLAAMFGHFGQETAHLVYIKEIQKSDYCATWGWSATAFPCVSGKQYYGRGAKQLSWNYNYGAFSNAIYGDKMVLLNNPDLVSDTWLNFASALWFYVTPQPPKPSMMAIVDGSWTPNSNDLAGNKKPGFGATTMVINGALECGPGRDPTASSNRIRYYKDYAAKLGVNIPSTDKLDCADMQEFDSNGSAMPAIYWAKESGCQLAKWQGPYSALVEGDYTRCQRGL